MPLVTIPRMNDGADHFASHHHAQVDPIAELVNGKLANDNISPTAAISTAKLAKDQGITTEMLGSGVISLGYTETATAQGSITTEVDLTGLSATVTVPAGGRRVRISAYVPIHSTVAGDRVRLNIKEGTAYLQKPIFGIGVAGTEYAAFGSAIVTPTAGAHTYKLSLQRESGTGTISTVAASANQAYIHVEAL